MLRTPLDDDFKITRNTPTLREVVLDKLRQAIMNFQLLPGDRLIERDLCNRLGVSRTSVREALRYLESEGLVEYGDGRGPRVAVISAADARDIYELRCVLEGMVVQRFTLHASQADREALDRAWAKLEALLLEGTTSEIVNAVSDFYSVLYDGAANHVAGQMLQQLQARVSYLRATSVSQKERSRESRKEMQRIVEAIKSGDAEAACEACIDHIRSAAKVALKALDSDSVTSGVEQIVTPPPHLLRPFET